MGDRPRYAIIPSNGRDCLQQTVEAIRPQVDQLIIVWAHKDDGYPNRPWGEDKTTIFYYPGPRQELNISQWWNEGLLTARNHNDHWDNAEQWDVAILNDDAIVPAGWFEAVSSAMREHGAAAACSGRTSYPMLLDTPGPFPGWPNPLTGYAFMLAGEKSLRANEDLHWYFTDNYIDWESRKLGGTVVIPGFPVQHLYPNGQMDHDIQVRTEVDAQVFVDLYGMRPW
jgi:hypothetical protein